MKYKRLTKKDINGNSEEIKIVEASSSSIFAVYNRLAELEDKIENGTLIKFPRICERKEYIYPYRLEYLDDNGDVRGIVCMTKREAEERLKRLQGKE